MNSQVMSRVVAFMIQKGMQLFEIPLTLATDLQAYWNKKERRKMSPLKQVRFHRLLFHEIRKSRFLICFYFSS